MDLSTPWMGPIGAFTWTTSLTLYETFLLGRYGWWWRMHRLLRRHFRGETPGQLVLRLRGADTGSLAYGETPSVSLIRVFKLIGLAPGSRLLDLGSGRGVPCLTAACLGYPAEGLEFFEMHVERANRVAQALGVPASFRQAHILDDPWPAADLILVASTAFPEEFREALEERLLEVSVGTWVLTHDWLLGNGFSREWMITLPVTWGTARFCLHKRLLSCSSGALLIGP